MRLFQIEPATLPEHLQHVVVLDFREAIPPGAMCERVSTYRYRGGEHPHFVMRGPDGELGRRGSDDANGVPQRPTAMLHAWLSDGDVAAGGGWTRLERWREFLGHVAALDSTFLHKVTGRTTTGRDDLFAEAIRYTMAPYHISGGITDDGEPLVVFAHPANLYTHHGGAANRDCIGIGFAWGSDESCDPRDPVPALRPELVTDNHRRDARARRQAVETALWLAHKHYGITELVTHAQSSRFRSPSSDGTGGDPGTNILWAAGWAGASTGLSVSFDVARAWGSGRRWPTAWEDAVSAGGMERARTDAMAERKRPEPKSCTTIACELERVAETAGDHDALRRGIKAMADMVRLMGGGA